MTRILALVFFLSGASALIFETLWFRLAGLALGNSVWATSLVLASFMGGLAVGNGLAGRYGHLIRRPVRFYAQLEVLIGVTGMILVYVFPKLNQLLSPVFAGLIDQTTQLNLLRGGLAFFLMLAPAAGMGATLPVLVRGLSRRGVSFGRSLGILYGCNTLGGMAGALSGEILLIELCGVRGTGVVAMVASCAAAAAAVAVAGRAGVSVLTSGPAVTPLPFSARSWRLLVAAFLSGGILLALEVVWFRFLTLFEVGTSLTFALMLSVVLAGIGMGSVIASRWMCGPSFPRLESAVALLAGVILVGTYASFSSSVWGPETALESPEGLVIVRSLRLMLLVSLLSGVLFTLIGKALYDELASDTRAAGYLTLANTSGAMLGALLSGFLLLPWLGMELSFFALAAAYGVVAVFAVSRSAPGQQVIRRLVLSCGCGLFGLSLLFFPFGRMHAEVFPHVLRANHELGYQTVAIRESQTETIFYLRRAQWGQPQSYLLQTNSHNMSATHVQARAYMKFFVYLPVALHPNPKRALLISYGVGSTARALTDTHSLEHIDVVDISRDILELNQIVYPRTGDYPLADPRVQTHIEDGRFFLQTSRDSWDLITAEPPPPKAAGVGNLYSKEYFQLIYDRLNAGGMATYWLPMTEVEESEGRAIIRSFTDVFGESSLWMGSGTEWILFGVREPAEAVSAKDFARQWNDPVVGPELRELGFESAAQLGAHFIADGDELRSLTQDSPPLVDNFPHRLSPRFPVNTMEREYARLLEPESSRERFAGSAHIRRLWPQQILTDSFACFAARQQLHDVFAGTHAVGPDQTTLARVHLVLTQTDLSSLVLWILGTDAGEVRAIRRIYAQDDFILQQKLGDAALAERNYELAVKHFSRSHGQRKGVASYRLIYALCLTERMGVAEDLAREVIAMRVPHPDSERALAFLEQTFDLRIRD